MANKKYKLAIPKSAANIDTDIADTTKQVEGLKYKTGKLAIPKSMPQYKAARPKMSTNVLKTIFQIVDMPRNIGAINIGSSMNLAKMFSEAQGKQMPFDYVSNASGAMTSPTDLVNQFRPSNQHTFYSDVLGSALTQKTWDQSVTPIQSLVGLLGGQAYQKLRYGKDLQQDQGEKIINAIKNSSPVQRGMFNFVTGLGLDIGLDPLTYVSFGSAGAAKAGEMAAARFGTSANIASKSLGKVSGYVDDLARIGMKADDAETVIGKILRIAEGGTQYLDDPGTLATILNKSFIADNTISPASNAALERAFKSSLTGIVDDIKQLSKANKLFDTPLLRTADFLGGKTLVKKPTSGTFERAVSFGDDIINVNVPRSLGIAMETSIANKYPGFAKSFNQIKNTFNKYYRTMGVEDVGMARKYLRQSMYYDSKSIFEMGVHARYLTDDLIEWSKKVGINITEAERKILSHTRELLTPTEAKRSSAKHLIEYLSNLFTNNPQRYAATISRNARALNLSDNVMHGLVHYYGQGNDIVRLQVIDTLLNHRSMIDFDSAVSGMRGPLKEALEKLRKIYDENWQMKSYAHRGNLSYRPGYAYHFYHDEPYRRPSELGRTTRPLSMSDKGHMPRTYETIDDALAAGRLIEEDAMFQVSYDRLKAVNAKNTTEFIDETIQNFGRKIVDKSQIGAGEKLWIDWIDGKMYAMPEFVADSMNKYKELIHPGSSAKFWTKFYDQMTGLWKGYITATPGFTVRNVFMGNTWAGYLETGWRFFEPENIKDGVLSYFAQFPELVNKYPMLKGTAKNGKTYIELSQLAGTNGLTRGQVGYDLVAQMTVFDEFMTLMNGKPSMLNKINPVNSKNAYLEMFRKINSAGEDISKLIAFNIEMQRMYGDSIGAAMIVKRYFFDYADLSDLERMWFRRAIPFYTWMRKNIPLQMEELVIQTGKYKVFPLGKKYLEDLSENGAPDDSHLPEYMQERYWMRTPIVDKWGNYLYFNPNFPPQDLAMLFNPKEWLSVATPFLKTPLELITNRSFFFDSPIKSSDYSMSYAPSYYKLIPEGLRDKLGLIQSKTGTIYMDPMSKYILEQIPPIRNLNRIFVQDEATQYRSPSSAATAMFLGFKSMPYRYKEEKLSSIYDEKERLNEYLRMLRRLGVEAESEKSPLLKTSIFESK